MSNKLSRACYGLPGFKDKLDYVSARQFPLGANMTEKYQRERAPTANIKGDSRELEGFRKEAKVLLIPHTMYISLNKLDSVQRRKGMSSYNQY